MTLEKGWQSKHEGGVWNNKKTILLSPWSFDPIEWNAGISTVANVAAAAVAAD